MESMLKTGDENTTFSTYFWDCLQALFTLLGRCEFRALALHFYPTV